MRLVKYQKRVMSELEKIWFFVLVLLLLTDVSSTVNHPLILVPGDAGSQVFAKLNKSSSPHYFCSKKTDDFFLLWLNLELLAPLVLDCWVDNMKLTYNNATRTTANTPGVDIRIPEIGDTFPVEYIDTSNISVSTYYGKLVKEAVEKWAYERNKSIRGVPYDFRKAPNEQAEFFTKLKNLVEQTYYANQNTKIVIVGHSMGNLIALYLFHQQSQAWKDKFIKAHVSIAAPWGGAAKVLRLLASGYNMDHYRILVNPITLRQQQRSMPSTAWLMPHEKIWPKDEPILVIEGDRNFTTSDYEQFYKEIQFDDGWQMYLDTKELSQDFRAPGVEMHCIYGVGLATPQRFIYRKGSFPNSQPDEKMGDGDGTVNVRSNTICMDWKSQQSQPVYAYEVEKWEHLEILKNNNVIEYVRKIAMDSKKRKKVSKQR